MLATWTVVTGLGFLDTEYMCKHMDILMLLKSVKSKKVNLLININSATYLFRQMMTMKTTITMISSSSTTPTIIPIIAPVSFSRNII